MEDVCNKVEVLGLRDSISVKLKKERIKEMERKMRKRKLKEGVEEVVVIVSEGVEIEVYNGKIGVWRVKSESKYEIGCRVRMWIYKVEEKTKVALVPVPVP